MRQETGKTKESMRTEEGGDEAKYKVSRDKRQVGSVEKNKDKDEIVCYNSAQLEAT